MKKQSSTLSGSRGRTGHPPACGQDTQLCIHMACTRTSRLCPCTVHLQLLFRHNAPPPTEPQTHAFVPCMGIHLPLDQGTHSPTEIRVHRAMHTLHLRFAHMLTHVWARAWIIHIYTAETLVCGRKPLRHTIQGLQTPTPTHRRFSQLHRQILTEPLPHTSQLGTAELQ